jgi:hypothetical protein
MGNFKKWLNKTYLESISHMDEWVQTSLIKETPHTHFEDVPHEFSFLIGSHVDLGFENLGLNKEDYKAISLAYVGDGVRIPDSHYKIRYHGIRAFASIEQATGDEPSLPKDWKQAVWTLNSKNEISWLGKKVREEQVGKVDLSLYDETEDGWILSHGS